MELPDDEIAQYNERVRDLMRDLAGEDASDAIDSDIELGVDVVESLVRFAKTAMAGGVSRLATVNLLSLPVTGIIDRLSVVLTGYVVHRATEELVAEQMASFTEGEE